MNFQVKLYIDDEVNNVLSFNTNIQKQADVNGRPSSTFTGGHYWFEIEATKSTIILAWMISASQRKTIKLVISPVNGNGKSTTIILGDAFCIKHTTIFNSISNQPLKEIFEVTPAYIKQNDVIMFAKWWKETDLTNTATPTVINEEEEKEILESYFEDMQGNRIDDPKIGTDANLVIKSENAVGKIVDIDLSDKKKDFVYKGQVLENDILKNLVIKSNTQKEKLTIIAQNK